MNSFSSPTQLVAEGLEKTWNIFFLSDSFLIELAKQFSFHRNLQTWAVAKFSQSLNISQWIKLLNPLISPHFFPLKSNIACASEFYDLTSITRSTRVCLRKSLCGHSSTEWTQTRSLGTFICHFTYPQMGKPTLS